DVAQVAPLLRAALQRRWIDDASPVVGDLSSSRREALGQAMLDGRPKPRRPLRTPLDRCLALLLDL
ncbi:MAG TPA: hypothetical protein PKA64_21800, partial [Myxococcota bacterium]|nr:hypothetical protein [Myxococcota bacterium]